MSLKEINQIISSVTKANVLNRRATNWPSVKFEAENLFDALNLDKFFQFKNGEETCSALKTRHQLILLKMTPTEQKAALSIEDLDDNDKKTMKAVFLAVSLFLGQHYSHLIRSLAAKSPSLAWSKVCSEFEDNGKYSKRTQHQILNSANIMDYNGNFGKMAEAIAEAAQKLADLGDPQDDDRLITSLICGLKGKGWKTIATVIQDDSKSSFSELVAKVKNMLRSRKARDTSNPNKTNSSVLAAVEDSDDSDVNWEQPTSSSQIEKRRFTIKTKRERQEEINKAVENEISKRIRTGMLTRGVGYHQGNRGRGRQTRGRGRRGRGRRPSFYTKPKTPFFDGECYICGKYGHLKSNCWHKDPESLKKANARIAEEKLRTAQDDETKRTSVDSDTSDSQEEEACGMMSEAATQDALLPIGMASGCIILDSGATSHFCCHENCFSELHRISPRVVTIAKRNVNYRCEWAGTVELDVHCGDKRQKFKLVDVLYSPECNGTYISIPKLDAKGFSVSIRNGTAIVSKGGKVFLEAKKVKDLYTLRGTYAKSSTSKSDTGSVLGIKTYLEWHNDFAHPSHRKLQRTLRSVSGSSVKGNHQFQCSTCDMTKSVRVPVNMKPKERDCQSERAHADVKTFHRSRRGFKYFLIFVHEKSRQVSLFLMKKKSEATKHLKHYIAMAENCVGGRFVEFRSDNGKEFTSTEFQEYLKYKGIAFKPSTPRTPEQNAIAERAIRTICKMIRSMLYQSSMTDKHWCYAAETAAYLYNRMSHKALPDGKTPHEIYTGQKPNVENLVPFGCYGVVHIDKQLRLSPLASRGMYGRMVGYHSRHGTYYMMLQSGKVKASRVNQWRREMTAFPSKNKKRKITRSPSEDEAELEDLNHGDKDEARRSKRATAGIPGARFDLEPHQLGFLLYDETLNNVVDLDGQDTLLEAMMAAVSELEDVPKSYQDAITGKDKEFWIASTEDEMKSIVDNGTWEIVEAPYDANIVACKWVFKKKLEPDDSIRYKSRLCAKGFSQTRGKDFFHTYAPTMALVSFRLFLAFCAKHGLDVHSADVKTAFLYSIIDADVYMKIPEGYKPQNENEREIMRSRRAVCKLKRSIYGLKQSSALFWKTITKVLIQVGFKCMTADNCILINPERQLIMGLYVDNMAIGFRDAKQHRWLIEQLRKHFKITDEGAIRRCLGINIKRLSDGGYALSQRRTIEKIFSKFNVYESKRVMTPRSSTAKLEMLQSPNFDAGTYRSMIGALIYLVTATRPDIAEAVSVLAQHSNSPKKVHKKAADRIMQYLYNTRDYAIAYHPGGNSKLFAVADASHGSCKITGKSRTGFLVFYANGPISWKSKRQAVVAQSTKDAEYMAMSICSKDLMFSIEFVHEANSLMGYLSPFNVKTNRSPVDLFCDNQPAIDTVERHGFTDKSKSIRLSYHNIRDLYQKNEIRPVKIDTKLNPADLLTKPLTSEQTHKHASMMFMKIHF